jgi:hypothetical protein
VQLLLSEYSNNYLTNGRFCGIIALEKKRETTIKSKVLSGRKEKKYA